MPETSVIAALYLVPAAALVVTRREPLSRAVSRILLAEAAALAVYFPLYALVGMLSWQVHHWGSMTLADILLFWQTDTAHSPVWIWLALGETVLVLLIRWGMEALRRRPGGPGRDVLMMTGLSGLLVFSAWLWMPVPLAKDTVQTELREVQVYLEPETCVSWRPQTMVDKQTARAIVDRMGDSRERNTLRRAEVLLRDSCRMRLFLRTEDTFWVVALGDWTGREGYPGWSGELDGSEYVGLAGEVQEPEALFDYVLAHIGKDLPPQTV